MPALFLAMLVSYLLGNVYIFVRGLQALGQFSWFLKWGYGLVYWTGALMLFAVFAFRRSGHIPFSVGQVLFHIGSGWLVFTLYMVIFLAAARLVTVFYAPFHHGFALSLLLTCGLLAYGYIRYLHPERQVIGIPVDKPLTDRDRLKIVAISDWHLGLGTGQEKLRKDIDRINAEKPDLILIGGDLIDSSVLPVIDREMDRELNRLQAPMGIYMTPGNHEYISGIEACTAFLAKTRIKLLRDSVVTLPCGLQLIGRDDRQNRNRLSVRDLTKLVDRSRPVILIDHQPYGLDEVEATGAVDLQFSGHTHDGQVFPLSLLTGYLFDLSYGYEKRGNTNFYVSSGFALWGPPFRIGTCSEMVVFECSFPENKKI
ncbi:MAG: metallophosphoesterase [Tannerella sp.]|jgi:predicted MPP superfamily phosphohydrolase|nr:metallophosphoesterase [Tannerella sp.]